MTQRRTVPTENQEQRALVKWWTLTHPDMAEDLIKQNNEGERTDGQRVHLTLMGMKKGASDLFLAIPRGVYHGLWLEVKRDKVYPPSARLTDTWIAQEKFILNRRARGYAAHFVFGWLHGKKLIEQYMSLPFTG